MTDQEKIEKLEKVIEGSFEAFKMLVELNVCSSCNELNKECVEKIFNKVKEVVQLKKEIV